MDFELFLTLKGRVTNLGVRNRTVQGMGAAYIMPKSTGKLIVKYNKKTDLSCGAPVCLDKGYNPPVATVLS